MKFVTPFIRPSRRASFIALITAAALSEFALAQAPKLTSDGGGGGSGGGQINQPPFNQRLSSCNPSNTVTPPSYKPVYVRAYTTVTPRAGGPTRYCVRPVLFNTAETKSPEALNLWLTDHRTAITSNEDSNPLSFSALIKSAQTTTSCQVQMPAVPAANGIVSGSAISDTTWCFDSYLPQPTLGVYLGVPAVNASQGANNQSLMKSTTPKANAKTFTRPTNPLPDSPVLGVTYAAYCGLDFRAEALAPPPTSPPMLPVQCAPVSNPRFPNDGVPIKQNIPGILVPKAPEKSGGSAIDASKKPLETRKP